MHTVYSWGEWVLVKVSIIVCPIEQCNLAFTVWVSPVLCTDCWQLANMSELVTKQLLVEQ